MKMSDTLVQALSTSASPSSISPLASFKSLPAREAPSRPPTTSASPTSPTSRWTTASAGALRTRCRCARAFVAVTAMGRRGLATRLMLRAEEFAAEQGWDTLHLEVRRGRSHSPHRLGRTKRRPKPQAPRCPWCVCVCARVHAPVAPHKPRGGT